MKIHGPGWSEQMRRQWQKVHPIRRASIRWRCEVRCYQRGMRTVVAHKPGVMADIRRRTDGAD